MNIRRTLVTASCAAALIVPTGLMAQQDTTRRDTTRMQESTRRRMQDSTRRRMQDSTRRDTTMRGMNMNRNTTRTTPPAVTPRATSDQRLPVQKRGEAAGTLDL